MDEKTAPEDLDQQWAKTLKIDYNPPVEPTPPPIPKELLEEGKPQTPTSDSIPPAPFQTPEPAPIFLTPPARPPKSYLVWAILATVACCLIPGIVAIYYSTQVSMRYARKDVEGANRASELTQYWIIAAIVLGVISSALYYPVMALLIP